MNKFLLLIITLIINNISNAQSNITNLITPVSYFVNHVKQITALKEYLDKYKQASIVGTSGLGKTQLARMYAYENKNNYNLIWFFDCKLDLNEEFLKLAKQLNQIHKANISEEATVVKKEVMAYLTNQDKWLLTFDNLIVNENKKIQDLVTWEHNGKVIFCAQDTEILPYTIEMTHFNREDSITLANNILENKDQKLAEFLAEEFKGYPVLIVQGAQLLNKVKGLNSEEYKRKILKSGDKIMFNIKLAINQLSPTAKKLLNKIALINNQNFSKRFLALIADDQNSIEDDIYQLSKFMLITNINADEHNPIFEMHDIIVRKVLEINHTHNNLLLEEIIAQLVHSLPKDIVKSHVIRNEETVRENLEVILENAQKYNVKTYKIMLLNVALFTDYLNTSNYYNAEKMLDWFNKHNQEGEFKLSSMKDDEKRAYAEYLALIGGYYKRGRADDKTALHYYIKSKEIFDEIKGYESLKCNVIYNLAMCNASYGQPEEAEKYILIIEEMFNTNLVSKKDIIFLHLAKTRLFLMQGKYNETLEQVNKAIEVFISNGVRVDDLLLTNTYLIRAEALNALGEYKEAYAQLEQLYNMHQSVKGEKHGVFGRIYAQMAKSKLGQDEVGKAATYASKAIAILLADEDRNPKEANYSIDPDLAAGYVIQGDILLAQDDSNAAIECYKKAQLIYFYLYKDRSKNIANVSYLYNRGAKAACKINDLYNYKSFGKHQVEEFGIHHPNTIDMLEYCKNYNMDLWDQKN